MSMGTKVYLANCAESEAVPEKRNFVQCSTGLILDSDVIIWKSQNEHNPNPCPNPMNHLLYTAPHQSKTRSTRNDTRNDQHVTFAKEKRKGKRTKPNKGQRWNALKERWLFSWTCQNERKKEMMTRMVLMLFTICWIFHVLSTPTDIDATELRTVVPLLLSLFLDKKSKA